VGAYLATPTFFADASSPAMCADLTASTWLANASLPAVMTIAAPTKSARRLLDAVRAQLAATALAAHELALPVSAIIAAVTLSAPRLGPPVLAEGLAAAALDAFAANSVVLAKRTASAFFTD
jgi:hypothetical protein